VRFDRRFGLFDVLGAALSLGVGLARPQQPQQQLGVIVALVQIAILARQLGLLFQVDHPFVQLAQDVAHPRQVVARVAQPSFRFAPALLVLGDPRRLLEVDPQLLRARLHDARDHSLADDRVRARAQAGYPGTDRARRAGARAAD